MAVTRVIHVVRCWQDAANQSGDFVDIEVTDGWVFTGPNGDQKAIDCPAANAAPSASRVSHFVTITNPDDSSQSLDIEVLDGVCCTFADGDQQTFDCPSGNARVFLTNADGFPNCVSPEESIVGSGGGATRVGELTQVTPNNGWSTNFDNSKSNYIVAEKSQGVCFTFANGDQRTLDFPTGDEITLDTTQYTTDSSGNQIPPPNGDPNSYVNFNGGGLNLGNIICSQGPLWRIVNMTGGSDYLVIEVMLSSSSYTLLGTPTSPETFGPASIVTDNIVGEAFDISAATVGSGNTVPGTANGYYLDQELTPVVVPGPNLQSVPCAGVAPPTAQMKSNIVWWMPGPSIEAGVNGDPANGTNTNVKTILILNIGLAKQIVAQQSSPASPIQFEISFPSIPSVTQTDGGGNTITTFGNAGLVCAAYYLRFGTPDKNFNSCFPASGGAAGPTLPFPSFGDPNSLWTVGNLLSPGGNPDGLQFAINGDSTFARFGWFSGFESSPISLAAAFFSADASGGTATLQIDPTVDPTKMNPLQWLSIPSLLFGSTTLFGVADCTNLAQSNACTP